MHQRWGVALLVATLCVATAGTGSANAQTAQVRSDDFRVWAAIAGSDEPSDFETFLRIYPNSLLAPLAGSRLATLRQRALSGGGPGPAPRADGGRLYRYRNSSRPIEATGVPAAVNRMHIRLEAPTGNAPTSLPIDDERLTALCADENGCLLTLGIVGWTERGLSPEVPLTPTGCRFFLRIKDGKRHWQVQTSCFQWYAVMDGDEKGNPKWNEKNPGRYVPFWSGYSGIDGADSVDKPGDDRFFVLYLGGCIIAESPPDPESKGRSGLLPDTLPGFYLIAGTESWGGSTYPSKEWPPKGAGRACELLVED